jgi:hypothetical protein
MLYAVIGWHFCIASCEDFFLYLFLGTYHLIGQFGMNLIPNIRGAQSSSVVTV